MPETMSMWGTKVFIETSAQRWRWMLRVFGCEERLQAERRQKGKAKENEDDDGMQVEVDDGFGSPAFSIEDGDD